MVHVREQCEKDGTGCSAIHGARLREQKSLVCQCQGGSGRSGGCTGCEVWKRPTEQLGSVCGQDLLRLCFQKAVLLTV